jgi:predicted GNAT family N-acyltransferase
MDDVAETFSLDRTASIWPVLKSNAKHKRRIWTLKRAITIVKTSEGLRKIGALRYSMYIEQDKKPYAHADSSKRCFLEPIDLRSVNLAATLRGQCIAGLRLTKARDALDDEYLFRLLSHTPFNPNEYEKVVVCSRLVLANSIRARLQISGILQEAFRISLTNGIDYAVLSARPALVPLYKKMGFIPFGEGYREKIAGDLSVLILDLRNREALSATRSLFLRVYDALTFRNRPQPKMNAIVGAFSFDRTAAVWPILNEEGRRFRSSIFKYSISLVKTAQDLRKIGELRYSMHLERDKKLSPYADSSSRCFLEPIDLDSVNIIATVRTKCVGGVRLTKADDPLEDESLLRLRSHIPFAPSNYDKIVLCSQLVLANSIRARLQLVPLLQEAFRIAIISGADYAVMSTRPTHVRLFKKLGWVQHGDSYHEEFAADLIVLVLDLRNREALSAVRSIFLRVFDAFASRRKVKVGA